MATEEKMNQSGTTYDETTAAANVAAESAAPSAPALQITSLPSKQSYKPGEAITFAGATFAYDGVDVTNRVTFSVSEGTAWSSDDKQLFIEVTYAPVSSGAPATAQFTLRRKHRIWPIIACFLVAAAIAGAAIAAYNLAQPKDESGSYLIPQGEMSDEEAQALVNEMAEKSRITISVAPYMKLQDDGALRVNFIVPSDNNGLSERIEIEQDGKVVFKSDIVKPGYKLEWGSSNGAHVGEATATIHAVDASGGDSGNPISVEVQIVGPDFDIEAALAATSGESSSASESAEAAK